jgi:hypothetical protein
MVVRASLNAQLDDSGFADGDRLCQRTLDVCDRIQEAIDLFFAHHNYPFPEALQWNRRLSV